MKVSIITVSYNSAETIEDTIQSVLNQSYPNVEYVIVDGSSKDDTISIIEKYQGKITRWISESDKGIYDAMNKGVAMATGDIVGILNSDDVYASKDIIEQVVESFEYKGVEGVYGDLKYVDRHDLSKTTRTWKSCRYKQGMFFKGWMPPHPAFFVKKEVYEKYGDFNLSLRSAADYEIMLRFIHKNQISIAYLPKTITLMREGGVSNISLKHRIKANMEDREAWKINSIKPKWYTLYWKPLSKVFQFLNR